MPELRHRVRVFVYRLDRSDPSYLLLRSAQGIEGCWSPIHGPIGFGEKVEGAIRREVLSDVGLARADELVDLQMTSRWLVGDEEVIEWNYGFRAGLMRDEGLRLDSERWNAFRWAHFAEAYPSLELEFDRAAILRLHAHLRAA